MTTEERLAGMRAELRELIGRRDAARETGDEPHFRWYAERAIKLDMEIRELEWETKAWRRTGA